MKVNPQVTKPRRTEIMEEHPIHRLIYTVPQKTTD